MAIKELTGVRACTAAVLMAAVTFLCGCTTTVFRHKPVWGSARHVMAMDAKQRALLISGGKFCSEPSPDVFSVVAQALSFGGSFGRSADPKAVEAALQAAFSSAEQGSTIPRTQTINMLRELMFRTCERFLSGGYSADELPIQAVRDQRLMVSILAIEQLTGVVVAKPVAISATASASQDSREALIRLDNAQKAVVAAEAEVAAAKAAFSVLEGKEPTCTQIKEKVANNETLDETHSKKKADCDKSASALAESQKSEARAREHHSDLRKLATGIGGSAATHTSGDTAGGIAQSAQVANVASIVNDIVTQNFKDGTEVMLFCLKNLGDTRLARSQAKTEEDKAAVAKLAAIETNCLEHMKTLVAAQTSHVNAEKAEDDVKVQAAAAQMLKMSNEVFDNISPKLESATDTAQKRKEFAERIKLLLPSRMAEKADCFANAVSKVEKHKCFIELPNRVQREIAEGE